MPDINRSKRVNGERLAQVKLSRGCESEDCQWQGEFTAAMLAFHHRDPVSKLLKIGRDRGSVGWGRLLEEIVKCDVLCENCHRRDTYA